MAIVLPVAFSLNGGIHARCSTVELGGTWSIGAFRWGTIAVDGGGSADHVARYNAVLRKLVLIWLGSNRRSRAAR